MSLVLFLSLGMLQGLSAPDETLADYLRKNRPPNTLVVTGPETRKAGNEEGLAAYGRKQVRVGGIDAIVPKTIAAFDDSLKQEPNLYDGLPREAKVLYLLTTFDATQMDLAVRRGIGINDLRGEPRAVFASLLPKRMGWEKYRGGALPGQSRRVDSGSLDGAELERVRLQLVKSLELIVPNGPDSATSISATSDRGAPGEELVVRASEPVEESEEGTIHGVRLRRQVENRLKAGALNTGRLDTSVNLQEATTVEEALRLAGRAAGQEILADVRIRSLPVSWNGAAIRAGDLLDALALSVGGAYRKVGGAYLLTSDVMGAGVRQVRFKAWDESVSALIRRRQSDWLKALRDSGAARRIAYAPDDPLAPDQRLTKAMEAHGTKEEPYPILSSTLPPGLRAFLQREQAENPSQGLQIDRVKARHQVTYRFVLPDGTPLRAESAGLGLSESFESPPTTQIPATPPKRTPPVALSADRPAPPILFRTEDPAEVSRAIAEARAHGAREVWLETRNAQALTGAVGKGVAVSLAIRPWDATQGASAADVDRTLLGDDGPALMKRFAVDPLYVDGDGVPYVFQRPVERTLAPGSSSWSSQMSQIAELGRTPGLAGFVLLNTEPHGYEGGRNQQVSSEFPPVIAAMSAFGYGDAMRMAFLRKHGVDPIDLGWALLRGNVDLRPTFFPDENLANEQALPGPPSPAGFSDLVRVWDETRGAANVAATKALIASLPNLPAEMEGRSAALNFPSPYFVVLLPLTQRGPLPTLASGRPTGDVAERMIAPARFGGADDFAADMVARATGPNARGNPLPAIDLSATPSSQWSATLDRTLVRVGS